MGDFGQNAKGGPLAFWPKWAIFMARLPKPRINRKYLSEFSENGLVGRGIYSTIH